MLSLRTASLILQVALPLRVAERMLGNQTKHAIYLALHGETEWNQERRVQGRLDSPLTARGTHQARLTGTTLVRLVEQPAACAIISSPLGRAQSTARIICEVLGITPQRIESDSRLAEVDLGSWAGLTRDEVNTRWRGRLDGSSRYNWYFRSPDGETLEAMSIRLRAWLIDVESRNQPIVAVAHGIASRVLRGIYLNIPNDAALELEVSRDAVFRLADGIIDRLPCE
jgi:broad specificity phosphatase PhoE